MADGLNESASGLRRALCKVVIRALRQEITGELLAESVGRSRFPSLAKEGWLRDQEDLAKPH
jgi:hypothetical protein